MGYVKSKRRLCAWCGDGAEIYALLPCQGAQTHPRFYFIIYFFFKFYLWRH